ncbi:AT hook motif-containing protein [Abeliophyllum distichum]|uniref:AT hook motif-containing protein n=1 Tax=Abeliophyllum distichum TaxID=126358 RepID=A0ABD1PSS3_9LAMI
MNQVIQGDDSGAPSVLPAKRGRGRPRKDPNLKRVKTARGPPGFDGVKGNRPQKVDRVDGNDNMVGQAVTGVVEASFDAGYMLTVKIGNSNTTLRGVVFKPGHYVPVTAENDIAPHVQMIRRNDIHFSAENRTWSRAQKLALQTAGTVGAKRKYASPKVVSSVPPVGVRGTVVPVVLQPVNPSNVQPTSNQMPSDSSQAASLLFLEDKDVETVEPLAMLPPIQSIPAGQIPIAIPPRFGHQIAQESVQNENASSKEGTPEAEKGEKGMESMELQAAGCSRSSEIQNKNGEESWIPSAEDCGVNQSFSTVPSQTASVSTPLYNYGTGRMTELLQALQENMKEIPLPVPEQPTSASSASEVEFHDTKSA